MVKGLLTALGIQTRGNIISSWNNREDFTDEQTDPEDNIVILRAECQKHGERYVLLKQTAYGQEQ